MAKGSRGPPKLPVQQLAILALCRFAEPVTLTSIFPYLPEMIESFGVEKIEVAKWAGLTSAVYSLAQCLTAVLWGRLSDVFGRKPTILLGLTFTMFTTLGWGVSTSLSMAIVIRALSGACNGNVGIIRTMVAEMVPEKELQPRAFSVMPLVWSIGSIFGPSFGGFFARPTENWPKLFGGSKFLAKYPFALPNLVASSLFAIGITIGVLYLRETLETRRDKSDYGLVLGRQLNKVLGALFRCRKPAKPYRTPHTDEESNASLLRPTSSSTDRDFSIKATTPAVLRPSVRDVFTRQSVINLIAYTFLALHSIAYDQMLPIFMHLPRKQSNADNTHLPFKFSGGFGLGLNRIGTLFTMYGVFGCFIQFLVFPPVARRFGVLKCFKACSLTYTAVYFVTPYTSLVQAPLVQQATLFAVMLVKCSAGIFAFPCSIILLTNSASSLLHLGTLNGVAVSVSAIGRAAGPAISGYIFSRGLEQGFVIPAWWFLGLVAAIGTVPIWWLVEMEGFSKKSDEEEEEEEGLLPVLEEEEEIDLERRERERERLAMLEGQEILGGDEAVAWREEDEAIDIVEGPPLSNLKNRGSTSGTTQVECDRSKGKERKLSNPIGMGEPIGPGGGRRLSNGLAASNLGQGTGGTSFN